MLSAFSGQLSALKRFGFLCLIILLTISPATIRNYLVSGKFVLISINGPVNLWIGNNPYAEGWFQYPPSEYSDKVSRKVKEKGDKAYIEEVARFAKEYPAQFIGLLFKKFLFFWDSTEIANNVNYELYKDLSWILKIVILGFGLIGSLALLGILLSLRAWQKNLLLYLFILSSMLATILLFVLARYRITFVPCLIPFAGFAIWWWYGKIKAKSYQTISFSLIPLIFFLSLAHSRAIEGVFAPYIHSDGFHIKRENEVVIRNDSGLLWGVDYYALQSPEDMIKKELIIKEDLAKFKEAVFFFNFEYSSSSETEKPQVIFKVNGKGQEIEIKSVQTTSFYKVYFDPNDLNQGKNAVIIRPKTRFDSPVRISIDSLYSFGRSYFFNKEGEWERLKKGEYMIWLVLKPERSVQGFMAQGIHYYKKGMYDKAIFEFQQAIEKDFDNPDFYYSLGLAYEKKKELDKAIEYYQKALKIDSEYVLGYIGLARVYYQKGMVDKTITMCQEVLKIDPKNIEIQTSLASIYYNKGILNEAHIEFQKVLELDPENDYAKERLEQCKISLDKQKMDSVK